MKVSELRINNYVMLDDGRNDGEIIMITGTNAINGGHVYDEEDGIFGCDMIKPIPLTEQWLLDFGFEKDEDFKENNRFHHINKIVDVMYLGGEVYWIDNYTTIFHQKIIYVHQLQNLHFALTGEELTIKEKQC